ncbi:MAG: hypothetical protein K1X53_14870 [Candidatus Sumerlaeaceae bacterium]|nr:hypothetical protein [Candidatus Sumerlaeaceae bacterium]
MNRRKLSKPAATITQREAPGFMTPDSAAGGGAPAATTGRWVLDLSSTYWQFEGIRPGQGVKEGFHLHLGEHCSSTFNWNGAEVPGDVYTDLWRAGEIDDPHFGRNSLRAKWAMEREWWYRCKFKVPESQRGRKLRLVFDGVDYACEVWLNSKYLGRHEGMFSPFEFEVGPHLYIGDEGDNGIVVKLDPPPRSYREVCGRKFAWHGDYWRTLTPMGIWKPIRLVATGPAHIADVYPDSQIHEDGSATVSVQVQVAAGKPALGKKVKVRAVIQGANCEAGVHTKVAAIAKLKADNKLKLTFRIPNAQLWWPWDLGSPNLHNVDVVVSGPDGAVWDLKTTRFGIREISMERNPGYTADEVMYSWTPVINGKRTFYRSGNWGGPPDIFYGRNSGAKYRRLVDLAKEANLNNLRIFGWHPTEVDLFYDLCDEAGITVWQDLLPIASINLPRDRKFRDDTYVEAVACLKALRRHPCLTLLEGGEESFYGNEGLEYNVEFIVGIEGAIRPYTSLPYIPTSPLNWPPLLHEMGVGKPKDSGHTHKMFYTIGALMLEEEVPTWDYAAIPEFAVSSAPNAESIRKFIPADEVWPPGPSWGHHWADLDIFRALNFQILGDQCTDSLQRFVDASQINQGTIFQWGIEHVRRRKPKSSAISICHFITFAPDFKWGIVDYFQEKKLSFDFVRRAFQPLLVSLQLDKRRWLPGETFAGQVWITNDLHRAYAGCTLQVRVRDGEGGRIFHEQSNCIKRVEPNSSAHHFDLKWKVAPAAGKGFRAEFVLLDDGGSVISENHYVLLCADQAQAKRDCERLSAELRAHKSRFHSADYSRFFPTMSGPGRDQSIGDSPDKAADFAS